MLSRSAGRLVRECTLRQRKPATPFVPNTIRNLSQSRPVLKAKKAKYVAQEENDFEEAADDDLFAPVTKSTTQTPSGQNQTASSSAKSSSKSPQTIFEDHLTFITDRLGPNPTNKALQVRSNALRQLLHYTSSKSQIERAVEVVPLWRESGRKVDEPTTAEFIDRCLLYNPPLLVHIFSNRPKYGMDIPSIVEARRILTKLVTSRPHSVTSLGREAQIALSASILEQASLFAALYPVYGLGNALSDVTSSALLAQACANVVLHLKPEAKGGKKESVKTLLATEEAKEFQAVVPTLVDALRSHKQALKASGVKVDRIRSWGQPYMNEEIGVVHKRMTGQSRDTPVEWRSVGTALWHAISALKKLGRKESNEVMKTLTKVALGCSEWKRVEA